MKHRIDVKVYAEVEPLLSADETELINYYRKASVRDRDELLQDAKCYGLHNEICMKNDMARAHLAEMEGK